MPNEYEQWTLCGVDYIAIPLKEWRALHEERDRLGRTTIGDDLTIRQLTQDLRDTRIALHHLLATASHHSWAHIENGPCHCKSCSIDEATRICSTFTLEDT